MTDATTNDAAAPEEKLAQITEQQLAYIYENIREVRITMDNVLASATNIIELGTAIKDMRDAVSDLSTYHPDYDDRRGTMLELVDED
ncbi:hypothetical protein ACFVAJ_16930 [Agromyces sp. NPDC057679]|uniref:hypothetical protein n=1 Tax=Agromyces sp. NPDC057679 TaxID=3346207 RepID=UPI00366C6D9C